MPYQKEEIYSLVGRRKGKEIFFFIPFRDGGNFMQTTWENTPNNVKVKGKSNFEDFWFGVAYLKLDSSPKLELAMPAK